MQQHGGHPERGRPGKIEDVVLVASGKGGVGKTTVSVNLALALLRKGRKVALLDADMYGPNVALMLGIRRTEEAAGLRGFWPILASRRGVEPEVRPVDRFGLKVMSAGFLISDSQAVEIGSNMMVGKVVESMMYIVDWGDSDTMIVDLPPGSDEPMGTIVKTTEVAGGIVVTTPQDVARLDARREIKRLSNLGLPLLGIVENMSHFVCAHCGERQEVFHRGSTYADLGAPVLGEIPLDPLTSTLVDRGSPVLLADQVNPAKLAFQDLADEILERLAGS